MTSMDTFEQLFRAAKRSAVHLEMRDGYMRSDPDFVDWQKGRRPDPDDRDSWWHPWYQLVQDTVARGVRVRRARIVSEPVSDYVRFEHDWTFANIAAGEQVRWLPRRHATDLALPGNDFWLIDGTVLSIHHFDGSGEWAGTELTQDTGVVEHCRSAFEAVWERAVPHQDYRPT